MKIFCEELYRRKKERAERKKEQKERKSIVLRKSSLEVLGGYPIKTSYVYSPYLPVDPWMSAPNLG